MLGAERPALRRRGAAAAARAADLPRPGEPAAARAGSRPRRASGWSASPCATPSSSTWPAAAGSGRRRPRSASSCTSPARATAACSSIPHLDALNRIKGYLTEEGLRERVVEVNLADPDRQPAWNLFAVAGRSPRRAAGQVDAVVDAFASALRWDEVNARALNLTTQAAQALVDLARQLPAELAPTIFEIPVLLSDDDWREAVLPYVSPASPPVLRGTLPAPRARGDHAGHEPDRPPAGSAVPGRPARQPASRPTTFARRWTGGRSSSSAPARARAATG